MKRLCLLALAVVSLTTTASSRAQDYDTTRTGLLNGIVLVGPGTQPPGRAVVALYNSLNVLIEQTSTNSSGSFSFHGVAPGNYRIKVNLAGYEEAAAEVSVYRSNTVTTVQPIVLKPVPNPRDTVTIEAIDAAELRLTKQARIHYQKAKQALDKGRLEEASGHLQHTIDAEPTFAHAYHLMGIVNSLSGDYTKAEAAFLRAIELDPRRADSYFGAGKALNLLNRPGDALSLIEKGLELSPNSPLGLFEKSRSQFSLRDYASAERTAHESLAQSTTPPSEIHLILANCYLNMRHYPDAATELELYLKLEPKSTSAAKAREVLSKLKSAGITPGH